ncbi:MAG: DUF4082 domain-containing protein, partial [Desulfuromonadaceae bacterium]|nr:DUF4082 domain-containing protein [Desulfuromonadaceae bacterium]
MKSEYGNKLLVVLTLLSVVFGLSFMIPPMAICAQTSFTIWPDTTAPGIVDTGPDNAVELGVKFRSNSDGFITGIRFYKAATNTGTHIGNLWSSTGVRLATATFSNETESGWQQVTFATPVAIIANTVYVVSYHTNTGHYSCDQNYFNANGVDNSPLYALEAGISGVNGVYAYGSASNFPSLGWNSSNYWVDVVFSTTEPLPITLSSIAVAPVDQTILIGATQQFTATGTYSDGSTQNVTGQTSWSSSDLNVATINSAALATARTAGSTTISAVLNGITGGTSLAVQVPPLTITTASLPNGIPNVIYSTTLVASGGIAPYSWSIVSGLGSLPDGLTLDNSTGTITGTPTTNGTFSFTVQASDAGTPLQFVTTDLNITVAEQANFSIWPAATVPAAVDSGPDSAVELGVRFRADSYGYITGIRFYKADTNTGTHTGSLWTDSGTQLATAT